MFSSLVSLMKGNLSPQAALELANAHLDSARNANSSEMTLTYCDEADTALSRIERSKRKDLVASSTVEDRILRQKIAATYFALGELLNSLGYRGMAHASDKKAKKWGGRVQEPNQSSSHNDNIALAPIADPDPVRPIPLIQEKMARKTAKVPRKIFEKNMYQPPDININKLPRIGESLESISQVIYCLNLLRYSSPEEPLDQNERDWLEAIGNDTAEQEWFDKLATDLCAESMREELNTTAVTRVACLVPFLEKDDLQQLLQRIFYITERSQLPDFNLLEGLAQLLRHAAPGNLNADDLIKILELINAAPDATQQQSPDCIYKLIQTVSHVLDAMADSKVKGLDQRKIRAPLAVYSYELEDSTDLHLAYQAAYASQALLYVSDDEKLWQTTVRRTGKVTKGVAGLLAEVKGLYLSRVMQVLGHIQDGLATASGAFMFVNDAYEDVSTLAKSRRRFQDCLKQDRSFSHKSAWYPALRCADVFLRNGQLTTFETLVCNAPCRRHPAFQWGICQRLGELAVNAECDDDSRSSAVVFLGEMYQNDSEWGQNASIKQWILDILMRLADLSGSAAQAADTLLQELEKDGDSKKQELYRTCREGGPGSHVLKVALLPLPLSDRVQSKFNVGLSLRRMKELRIEGRGQHLYIPPLANRSLYASESVLFPLMDKVEDFLDSDQMVFLLLGDSGAGKSTFSQQLECDLWNIYKSKEDRIPLLIYLAAIENPEYELVAKRLRKEGFSERQIRELKSDHEFILICDGYDESQQTHNLYITNRLNQPGEWRARMVITCSSEYLGLDYRNHFQPTDESIQARRDVLQEAVIAPFTREQIQNYVNQYVSVEGPTWQAADYLQAFDSIPNLKDLVTNPLLLALSLEVLPHMTGPEQNFSMARVTRITLYDQFSERWLERGRKRLVERMSDQERKSFKMLSARGFKRKGIAFMKDLATAIFENQAGHPVVEYSSSRDQGTWKETFFGLEDEKKLLREACPLSHSGDQYHFIHRSLLEYSLACAVFEPQEGRDDGRRSAEMINTGSRWGGVRSAYDFEGEGVLDGAVVAVQQSMLESLWKRKNFMCEQSVLRFLDDRARQEPLFSKQLLAIIERSKTEEAEPDAVCWAAANAITILVRAGVQFNGADLRGIRISGADLSHGVFDSAQLQGADLEDVILRGIWLSGANLDRAQMTGVLFGEIPFLEEASKVMSCVHSPHGKTFAVGLFNGDISIYSMCNWEKARTLRGHNSWVTSVVYSPSGDQIASGSHDETVRLWDVETGDCRHTLSGHSDRVTSVVYSPSGGQIASGSHDETVRLWDVETGYCRHTLRGHDGWVTNVVYSRSGDQIASSSFDDTVRLWDVETGDCRHTLRGHDDWVTSVVYSPSGGQIASGGHDKTVRLWDFMTGDCRHTLSGHSDRVASVVYSPSGGHIASGSEDRTVRLWDVETGDCCHTLCGHDDWVTSLMYSPSGDQIASGSRDKTVRLWDVETGDCRHTLSGHGGWVTSVVYSPGGGQIASGSYDNTVRLWDVETGDCRHTFSGHNDWVKGAVYSSSGDQIASGSHDLTVRLWDVETRDCRHTLSGHSSMVTSVVYSPSGDKIASGSHDKTVRLWDFMTGDCRHTLRGHDDWVTSVVYSPSGGQIASGSHDKTVRQWDFMTGDCRHTLSGHSHWVTSVVYSPSGDQIASGSSDKTVRLWDVETGDCRHILRGHDSMVTSVVYSPRGDQIASGSSDGTVRLWDVETGDCRRTLSAHSDWVTSVVYSPSGDQIASGSSDKTVRLWDVETGDCRHILSGHSDRVTSVVYSPSGDQIASGSYDKTLRLWDIVSGHCMTVTRNHAGVGGIAWRVTFGINGLVVGCVDGTILLLEVRGESNEFYLRLHWRSPLHKLSLLETSIQDVRGLSWLNMELLKQRGAIGEPDWL